MSLTVVFYLKADFYLHWRGGYYFDWFAQLWPALFYLLLKKNEDCFGCFNRMAPQPYSVVQFSQAEIAEAELPSELKEAKDRWYYLGLLIIVNEMQQTRFDSFKRSSIRDSEIRSTILW